MEKQMSFEEWMDELYKDHQRAEQKEKSEEANATFRKMILSKGTRVMLEDVSESMSKWLEYGSEHLDPKDLSYDGRNGRLIDKAVDVMDAVEDLLCTLEEMK